MDSSIQSKFEDAVIEWIQKDPAFRKKIEDELERLNTSKPTKAVKSVPKRVKEIEEVQEEDSSESQSSTKSSSQISEERPKKKIKLSAEEYDDFLKKQKLGRLVRIGDFNGMAKSTPHRCTDTECAREWKPSPSQCLADDYYCPSCVLHHRNNVDRFDDARLAWTADVPNTFYVFSLTDPSSKKVLVKFGRTQNDDANMRYAPKEQKKYKMKMLLSIRGRLITMTKIENWWKEEAEDKNYFCRFSDSTFHGLTECIDSQKILDSLIENSITTAKADKATKIIRT
eukprot:TRINITY_DN3879_c0_g1_i2.p1 TRINITY_DN3879_c0_g1~~TRINITY_DN3879_c0_g1_i2.p1  ORF type:complete len:284 (+),score=83.21 TRINITY_DN3879_c0_g1_i2:31-882(+)